MSFVVVPLQVHAEVECARLINDGDIIGVEHVVEVVKVKAGTGGGADAEVVDHEGEGGVASEVTEEAAGTCFVVPVHLEVCNEFLVCKYDGLG